jgi:hypothetical protein
MMRTKSSSNIGDSRSLADGNLSVGSNEWISHAVWAPATFLQTTFLRLLANDFSQRLSRCKKQQTRDELGAPWIVHEKLKSLPPTPESAKGGL